MLCAQAKQLVFRHRFCVVVQRHDSVNATTQVGVGETDNGNVIYSRMLANDGFDFSGKYIRATLGNEVGTAICQI